MKKLNITRKKAGNFETNVSDFNNWEDFCRMSCGQSSLYDRIVYLYGLRLSKEYNHNAILSSIPEYENVYLTNVKDLYLRLSIGQLRTLRDNLFRINALRRKLIQQVNDPAAPDILWDEESSEQKLHEERNTAFLRTVSLLEKEIRRKEWELFWKRTRPVIYFMTACLLLIMGYFGLWYYQVYAFNRSIAQMNKELLDLRQIAADSSWSDANKLGKWKKQSVEAGKILDKATHTKVPFLLVNDITSLYRKAVSSNGESSYQQSIDQVAQNVLEYKRFSYAISLCEDSLKKYVDKKDLTFLSNSSSPCWRQLTYPNEGYEKNPSDKPYPLINVGEKQKTQTLFNERNQHVIVLWGGLLSKFDKTAKESDLSKIDLAELNDYYRQFLDIYSIWEQNSEKPKDLIKYTEELTNIGNSLFRIEIRKLVFAGKTIRDNQDLATEKAESDLGLIIDRMNRISPRKFMREDFFKVSLSKSTGVLGEFQNEIRDRANKKWMTNLEPKISGMSFPEVNFPDNLSEMNTKELVQRLARLEECNNSVSQIIQKLQLFNNELVSKKLLSKAGGEQRNELQAQINSKINSARDNLLPRIKELIQKTYGAISDDEIKVAYNKIGEIRDQSQVNGSAPDINQLLKGREQLEGLIPQWLRQSDSNSSIKKVVESAKELKEQINQKIAGIHDSDIGGAIAKGHLEENIKLCDNEMIRGFQTDLEEGKRELSNILTRPEVLEETRRMISDNIKKMDKRKIEFNNQTKFNDIVSELGLATKSRASIPEFQKRLQAARGSLSSSFWASTHLRDDCKLLLRQIDQYTKFYTELLSLRSCCGATSKDLVNKTVQFLQGDINAYASKVNSIQQQIRAGSYNDILQDINTFSLGDWNPNEDALMKKHKFIGFLDKDQGNPDSNYLIVRYREAPPIGSSLYLYKGPDYQVIHLCNIEKNPKGTEPAQVFKTLDVNNYLGKPVYLIELH